MKYPKFFLHDSSTAIPDRLKSLDALRGFTMFWIIGSGAFIHSLAQATDWQWFNWLFSINLHILARITQTI